MNEVSKYEIIFKNMSLGSRLLFLTYQISLEPPKKNMCPIFFQNEMSCSNDMVHHQRYKPRESPFLEGVAGPVLQSDKPILWLVPRSLLWATAVTFYVGFVTTARLIDVGASGAKAPGMLRSFQNLWMLDAKYDIEIYPP